MTEPLASSPLWLQFSGLPLWLNENVHKSAWLVFKTVVEIDCARNARPGTVELPPAEVASQCGLDPATVMRVLEGLRKKKCLALFLPDHPEENALIEIKIPLPVPKPMEEILQRFPFNTLEAGVRLRYTLTETREDIQKAAATGARRDLEKLVDLYLNIVGLKINTFVIDELRLLTQRFDMAEVEKAFTRAAKNDIRSLGWVVKELYRTNRRKNPPVKTAVP